MLSLSIAAELGDEVAALTLLSTTLWYDGWAIPWYRLPAAARLYHAVPLLVYLQGARAIWPQERTIAPLGRARNGHKDASMVGASRLNLPAIQEAERLISSVKKSLRASPLPPSSSTPWKTMCPRRAVHYIVAKHIGSGTVESVMLHNSYHMITVDNDREQVAADTIRFFEQRTHHNPANRGVKIASAIMRTAFNAGTTSNYELPANHTTHDGQAIRPQTGRSDARCELWTGWDWIHSR